MKKKILVIGTGGTIASTRGERICLDNPFKIIECVNVDDVSFECVSPFSILSENMSLDYWERLIDYLNSVDFEKYLGVIILHGSDTLAYTGAILGNIFYDTPIVLVAGNLPPEEPGSNACINFCNAVDFIRENPKGVFISYDAILPATRVENINSNDELLLSGVGADRLINPSFKKKNILVIHPYVGICYENYNLDGVDAVLHTMYHSATCPQAVLDFISRCEGAGVRFCFVTTKSKAEYESSNDFKNIIFNSTLENDYARLLLS